MNKIVNGKQLTIVWHVDDCKISHEDKDVVDDTIRKLEECFGDESSITVTPGKVHDYLGMTINYSTKGEVKFYMYDYVVVYSNMPLRRSRGSDRSTGPIHEAIMSVRTSVDYGSRST